MQTELPNKDTTVGIFDVLYKCRIPVVATKSIEEIKLFGMYSTGDKNLDKAQSRAMTTTFLNIANMADYYSQGAQVAIVNHSDVKQIYDDVTRHIMAWREQLDSGINIGMAPVDDLIALDQFAAAVYEHAKFNFDKNIIDSINLKYLANVGSFNRGNFFSAGPPAEPTDPNVTAVEKEVVYPERDSYGAFFKTRLPRSNTWR